LLHLLAYLLDELLRRHGKLERTVVGLACAGEVPGQVFVGVPVPVRPGHPDLLAAELLAQGRQGADFVRDAVDPLRAVWINVNDGVTPGRLHHALDRHVFVGRIETRLVAEVSAHELDGAHHRPVTLVARAHRQRLDERRHHAAVMGLVGATDRHLHGLPISGPARLPLFDQSAQCLLVDDGVDHLSDDVVRMSEGGIGDLEEQVVLPSHALEVLE
jgi:hypothetical protein